MNPIRTVEPSAQFPYSHAVVHGGLVYVSGQVGFKPGTTAVVSDNVSEQARQAFAHLDRVLAAAGTDRERVLRCGVYLRHAERDFTAFNACYAEWLGAHRPARSTIEASLAMPEILVEVDCIAALPDGP